MLRCGGDSSSAPLPLGSSAESKHTQVDQQLFHLTMNGVMPAPGTILFSLEFVGRIFLTFGCTVIASFAIRTL